MKYPKLRDTIACKIALLSPIVIIIATCVILSIIFPGFEEHILLLSLFPLIISYVLLCVIPLMSISVVKAWKKDRLWYTTDCNENNRKKALAIIENRIKNKKCPVDNFNPAPAKVYYKKTPSFSNNQATYEKITIIYETDYLDEKTYNTIINTSKKITKNLKTTVEKRLFFNQKKDKAPTVTGTAVIILADYIDHNIPEPVRNLPDFENTAIVPCVADFSCNRYYFDGKKDINFGFGKPAKNIAIDLIIKYVFDKKLPLKGNDKFDYSQFKDADYTPDTTLWFFISDLIKAVLQEIKASKSNAKKYGKSLKDGEMLYEDDELYIKKAEKLAIFTAMADYEDNTDPDLIDETTKKGHTLGVIVPDTWSYPKKNKISKKDRKELKEKAKEFFVQKGFEKIEFID